MGIKACFDIFREFNYTMRFVHAFLLVIIHVSDMRRFEVIIAFYAVICIIGCKAVR